jgi:hypothetical protein
MIEALLRWSMRLPNAVIAQHGWVPSVSLNYKGGKKHTEVRTKKKGGGRVSHSSFTSILSRLFFTKKKKDDTKHINAY